MPPLSSIYSLILRFSPSTLSYKGASFSLNKGETSYMVQTEYKTILFVKHPTKLVLNDINILSYE